MSSTGAGPPGPIAERPVVRRGGPAIAITDGLLMARRGLLRYKRIPALVIFSTIQPVMFVLLFRYVFGGSIRVPGVDYVDYLVPAIFVQSTLFGAITTGVGMADDLSRGMIERFRSLPMARSGLLVGRTLADSVRNLFVVVLMAGVGYLVGFRFHGGLIASVAVLLLAVLFGMAFSWVSMNIGLAVRDAESTQAASFIWIFPLVFASSAFVTVESMPGWLQAFAKVNPVTVTVDALRDLVLARPATTHLLQSFGWMAAVMAVFVPLAVRRYRRVA